MSPVKTTSPKKYCVRPNVGIIKPNSTYDFTVCVEGTRAQSKLVVSAISALADTSRQFISSKLSLGR
ncbi:hypothetical protein ACS0TY_030998 [Phlomoides rotata]